MRWLLTFAAVMVAAYATAAEPRREAGANAEFREAYAAYRAAVSSGNRGAAVEQAQRALQFGRKLYGRSHPTTAALHLNLGKALLANHQDPEALKVLRTTLKDYERLYDKNAAELIDPLVALGNASNERYQPAQLTHYQRALKIARKQFGDPSDVVVQLETDIGARLLNTGHIQAGEYLRKALEDADSLYGRSDVRTFWPLFNLARYRSANHDYRAAEALLKDAIATVDGRPESDNGRAELSARAHLVNVLEREGKSDEATKHCVAIGAAVPWNGERNPTPLYAVAPEYPASASHRGLGGYVLVEFRITPGGFVQNPRVIDHKGIEAFDKNALDAIKKWRYAPKVADGQPVLSEPRRARVIFQPADSDELRRATLSRFD